MSNADLAAIIVPIVVALALAAWMTMVYRADRHPGLPGPGATVSRAAR